MPDAEIVASRTERTLSILCDPRTPDVLYAHVCNGGTIIDLCETWGIHYSDVMKWIDSDKARQKLWHDACVARNNWTDEMVLGEARLLARFDLRQLYEKDGSLKNVADLDPQTARAVQSIDVDELFEGTGKEREQVGFTKKVKLWDKMKALEQLMKNRGLVVDRHQVQQVASLEDIIAGSWNAPLPADAVKPEALPAPATPAVSPAPALEAKKSSEPAPIIIIPGGQL